MLLRCIHLNATANPNLTTREEVILDTHTLRSSISTDFFWWHDNKISRESHDYISVIFSISYHIECILPATHIPSAEIKWKRPLGNCIIAAGIWSPLGLSEAAIFDLPCRSTEPFPQDGEGDSNERGRLPSRGCRLSTPASLCHQTGLMSLLCRLY